MKTRIQRLRYIFDELHRLSNDKRDTYQNFTLTAIAGEVRTALTREKLPYEKRPIKYTGVITRPFQHVTPFNGYNFDDWKRNVKNDGKKVQHALPAMDFVEPEGVTSFTKEDSLELLHLQPDTKGDVGS